MITPTAEGKAQTKVSGTTLTVSSVNPETGSMLVVGVTFENSQGAPSSVMWNNRTLKRRVFRDNASAGMAIAIYTKNNIHRDVTDDVVVTWSSAIAARAMVVTTIRGGNYIDERKGNVHLTATTTPTTGSATPTLESVEDFALVMLASSGPVEDTAGTPQIQDGGSFVAATAGQREGTTGGGAGSNVTIAEIFLGLSANDGTRGRINGDATSRRWANGLLVIQPGLAPIFRGGITPSDVMDVEEIFANISPPVDTEDIVYCFNSDDGVWEAFDLTTQTLRAISNLTGWVAA